VLPMTLTFNLLFAPKSDRVFWIGMVVANLTVIHAIYRFV
jgi:hypothetical protein